MSEKKEKAVDQILDLLLDALSERHQERKADGSDEADTPTSKQQAQQKVEAKSTSKQGPKIESQSTPAERRKYANAFKSVPPEVPNTGKTSPEASEPKAERLEDVEEEAFIEEAFIEEPLGDPLPTIHMNKIFYRLAIALTLLIIIVNVPFNRFGTSLARAMPDEQALIVRDGLVFKGPGEKIYVLEDNQKRWISSLTSFEENGYYWSQVKEVDQAFVDQFNDGHDLHALIKCNTQPHIYVLEEDQKRWIENPREFENAGFKWEDVRTIGCAKLKRIPDGTPIPEDAGEPPSW